MSWGQQDGLASKGVWYSDLYTYSIRYSNLYSYRLTSVPGTHVTVERELRPQRYYLPTHLLHERIFKFLFSVSGALPACTPAYHVWVSGAQGGQKVLNLLELELQTALSHDMGAKNWTWVLWKCSKRSKPLIHLSSSTNLIITKFQIKEKNHIQAQTQKHNSVKCKVKGANRTEAVQLYTGFYTFTTEYVFMHLSTLNLKHSRQLN